MCFIIDGTRYLLPEKDPVQLFHLRVRLAARRYYRDWCYGNRRIIPIGSRVLWVLMVVSQMSYSNDTPL